MKLGLSDLININLYPDIQPEHVGPKPYKTELFVLKFKFQTQASSLGHRHELSNVIPFISTLSQMCENTLMHVRLN